MFWSTSNSKQQKININKCFSEKYVVEQTSEITMSSLVIKTVTELRWDVRVVNITDAGYHIEFLMLENVLKESNNPNMRDLNAFNNAFKRMYSELSLLVDKEGELLEVKNIPQIQRKWAQVKADMEALQTKHHNLKDLIALNDTLFNNPLNILAAVRGNEFFEVFFNVYLGLSIPGGRSITKRSLFAQENISWAYHVTFEDDVPNNEGRALIQIVGHPKQNFDKTWIKNAYGSFPISELADRLPVVTDEAQYQIDFESGKILEGQIIKEEIVHPEFLKAKTVYKLMADNLEKANESHVHNSKSSSAQTWKKKFINIHD